jgi:hypothetical protein
MKNAQWPTLTDWQDLVRIERVRIRIPSHPPGYMLQASGSVRFLGSACGQDATSYRRRPTAAAAIAFRHVVICVIRHDGLALAGCLTPRAVAIFIG